MEYSRETLALKWLSACFSHINCLEVITPAVISRLSTVSQGTWSFRDFFPFLAQYKMKGILGVNLAGAVSKLDQCTSVLPSILLNVNKILIFFYDDTLFLWTYCLLVPVLLLMD